MDTNKFGVVLHLDDPDFAEKLAKALGVEEGQAFRIMGPQFERTDGRTVDYIPTTMHEFLAIQKADEAALRELGLQKWDEGHWLYPSEWYEHIPAGLPIVTISDEIETFQPGITDNDMRFGVLAYGFKV